MIPQPVCVVHTGQHGHSRKTVDLTFLHEAMSNSCLIKLTELACVLGMHQNTLWRYMKRNGIEKKYSSLTNTELDELVAHFKTGHPESGLCYMMGFLRRHGYHVQYSCVQHSLYWLDHVGQVLKNQKLRKRRKYHVKRPNALWHIDGHHKLI